MKYLIFIYALLCAQISFATTVTEILNLPLGSAAASNPGDSFPVQNAVTNETMRLTVSDITNLPAFATYNAPTCTQFESVPTGCTSGQFATGIAANGNLTCSTPSGGGSSGLTVSSISASASLTAGSPVNYQHVACNATSGNVVATLPLCSGHVGQVFNLKKVDSSSHYCEYAVSGSDLIDGQVTFSTSTQYQGLTVVCRAAGIWDVM